MKFYELAVHTNTAGSEELAGLLIVNDITAFSIEDPADFLDIVENKSVPFDYYEDNLIPADPSVVTLRLYLPQNEQGADWRKEVLLLLDTLRAAGNDYGPLTVDETETDDRDWADNWKQYFHPLPIGRKFVIKPSWETYTAGDRLILEIDPESSFGTGQHETTRLCLESCEDIPLKDADVLDMGCGSGILGIGAALLGARHITAVDIDRNAADIAAKNFGVNRIPVKAFTVLAGNVLADQALADTVFGKKYNLIFANIVADVLVQMLPSFASCLSAGGTLILSGIIAPRKQTVLDAAKSAGFADITFREENDWVCVVCRK